MDIETLLNNPIEPEIVPGVWYWMRFRQSTGQDGWIDVRKRYLAVKEYERFWLFEDESGCRACFTMWELARIVW